MKNILLFLLFPSLAVAQAAQADTAQGVALVIVEYTVSDPGGDETPVLSIRPVYAIRTRRESPDVKIAEPTGQLRAYVTNYYHRDSTPIEKEDVLFFQKRAWKN